MPEIIRINIENQNNSKWTPYQGEEIEGLLRFKGFADANGQINSAGERIIDETFRIMEMCNNPMGGPEVDTGLVIGYVQSGKTLSFTSLTALARDNNYQVVVIIAGTSKPLSEQSYERVKKDLRYDDRPDRKWVIIKNPESQEDRDIIDIKLSEWANTTYDRSKCSTMLLTVMKNGNRLSNLTTLLRNFNLQNVPTLIIDDESDQASLNTRASVNSGAGTGVNEGEVSTIYRRITDLRACFPHHTFLQYTATPQANLFVNIMDRLSPNFIKLLTPGSGYTGGGTFFIRNPSLVLLIPSAQIPTNNNVLLGPPETLLHALRIFFLGSVSGDIRRDQRNRSMMVHPSRLTDAQNVFFNWVKDIVDEWRRLLNSDEKDEKDELLDEFRIAYGELRLTVGDTLESFEELTGNLLIQRLTSTRIVRLNASRGTTPSVNWRDFYSVILVGGQAMDRGFTVEGLTVTYMPRNLGTGQVDTTLQRARFFGYKGSYLGFCRVWLDQDSIDAYRVIIEHEEDVRRRLEEYDVNNKHLNDWDRKTVLDRMLTLTRPNILYNNVDRDYFGSEWFTIKAPHDTDSLIAENAATVKSFLESHIQEFKVDQGHANRTEEQKHLLATLKLSDCLGFLNRLKFTRESDSQTFSSLRGVFALFLQDYPNELCDVYVMSSAKVNGTVIQNVRQRRLHENLTDTIKQLFQGKNPKSGPIVYPGDREIRDENRVTIQVHRLWLVDSNGQDIIDEQGDSRYQDVPTIAIWIPDVIGRDIVRQASNTV